MESITEKPILFNIIRWIVIILIIVSTVWILIAFIYSDKYVTRVRTKAEAATTFASTKLAQERARARGEPEPPKDLFLTMEPKKIANLIRTLSIVGIVIQCIFLYGFYRNNLSLTVMFTIWSFLMSIGSFKIATRDHLFWIPAMWFLIAGLLTSLYVHCLRQYK